MKQTWASQYTSASQVSCHTSAESTRTNTITAPVTPSSSTRHSVPGQGEQPARGPARGPALSEGQSISSSGFICCGKRLAPLENDKQLYKKCQQETPSEHVEQCCCTALKELEHIASHTEGETQPVTSQHYKHTVPWLCSLTPSAEVLQRQNGCAAVK